MRHMPHLILKDPKLTDLYQNSPYLSICQQKKASAPEVHPEKCQISVLVETNFSRSALLLLADRWDEKLKLHRQEEGTRTNI